MDLTPHSMIISSLQQGIEKGVAWLLDNQRPEGFWVGNLETNSCMEAEWVLAMHFLGVKDDPKYESVVRAILNEQRTDGSWEVYYQAPMGDINVTVECYTALRASGMSVDSPPLCKARKWILEHGGLAGLRVFTRYWLALFGEWPWDATPALLPEIIFLPSWAPFNVYRFASWARGTIIPLTVLRARRTVRKLPSEYRIDELFPETRERFDYRSVGKKNTSFRQRPFYLFDNLLSRYTRFTFCPGRELAIRQCLEWIVRHQEADGAWSGIQPPWIYSLLALHAEGYALDHPVLAAGLDAWNKYWKFEKNGATYLHASDTPVWDTLLSLLAILDCDQVLNATPQTQAALEWILNEQVMAGGDWQVYVKDVEPGGWAFERQNDFYPDVDDTAVAVIVLLRLLPALHSGFRSRVDLAVRRAVAWMNAMQSSNGGWGAFDKDNTSHLITLIPFCDFGEVLDPPSVDVTAHVLEALGLLGRGMDDPVVARAYRYIRGEQEKDGSWFGRWGVNHIYGTAAVLPALKAIGEDMDASYVQKAARWIVGHQNPDGGWGESCGSYMDIELRGRGPSTASQTGWALMALVATGSHTYDQVIKRGLEWLLTTQRADGTWNEPQYTGTGFPGYGTGERTDIEKAADNLDQGSELSRGFMLNYNMYRHYFPLMAMGRAMHHLSE
ncbi:MAG: squalene--hopene cyclase [delta proteobacterium ML8_D]|jgi:squalene-hopene/tetraprenyl-beta-curcumene cyclase|nr:MAG: squalene--hopene cyclase [delta proteobacterium ML8_D]